MNNLIILNKNDNVAVTPIIIDPQTKIEIQGIVSIDPIPFGHKICLKPINKGEPVIKYDQIIGFASKSIRPGEHVHSHNLEFKEFSREFTIIEKKNVATEKSNFFMDLCQCRRCSPNVYGRGLIESSRCSYRRPLDC